MGIWEVKEADARYVEFKRANPSIFKEGEQMYEYTFKEVLKFMACDPQAIEGRKDENNSNEKICMLPEGEQAYTQLQNR